MIPKPMFEVTAAITGTTKAGSFTGTCTAPAREAAALLTLVEEREELQGYVAAHSITVVHYVVARGGGKKAASAAVADLLRIAEVVPLVAVDFSHALVLEAGGMKDFEDAVQASAALKVGADYVVTSNKKDFRALAARTPSEMLAELARE